jgi:hypothetical protein
MEVPFVTRQLSLIFLRMLALVFLAVAPGIDDDKKEDQKSNSEENHHPGTIFPYLLNSVGKLGPIHVLGRYTAANEK